MRTRSRFDQVIETQDGGVRVQCRPRGSALRDLADRHDWFNYLTDVPGVLGIIGWLLHHSVFRSKWFVTVEPLSSHPTPEQLRWNNLSKAEADDTFEALIAWLEAGRPLQDFDPRRTHTDAPGARR